MVLIASLILNLTPNQMKEKNIDMSINSKHSSKTVATPQSTRYTIHVFHTLSSFFLKDLINKFDLLQTRNIDVIQKYAI